MGLPPLLVCESIGDYHAHYLKEYCRKTVKTFDGIRIYFSPNNFEHAFYESSRRDGRKDVFSPERAQRMDWIKATLENPRARLYQGWDKKTGKYSAKRRVAVVYEDFVVILAMRLKKDESMVGRFLTCYQASNSIGKIRRSPEWTRVECLKALKFGK